MQRSEASGLFYTPGIYYRPATLKSMTCLLDNKVYDNFHLENLNSNAHDYTHELYQKYLERKSFVQRGGQKYWSHMENNRLPTTPSKITQKGLFNVFPLCLTSENLFRSSASSFKLGMSAVYIFSPQSPPLLFLLYLFLPLL